MIEQTEAVYTAEIDANAEFDTTMLRYTFKSLNTPVTWIDYDVASRTATVVKQTRSARRLRPSDYVTVRDWATAEDGTRIPMSIIHRNDFVKDGTAPGLLYGYGSYEISIDPTFSIARLNLVDRGIVFAIAHIRGGGEMGRGWYENGKMLKKRNTFTDFIACARHMIDNGWVRAGPPRRPRRLRRRPAHGRGRRTWRPSCSTRLSPRCPSSTWSRRCRTRRSRSPSPSGRSGVTRATTPTTTST